MRIALHKEYLISRSELRTEFEKGKHPHEIKEKEFKLYAAGARAAERILEERYPVVAPASYKTVTRTP